jgi:hypothetical protein
MFQCDLNNIMLPIVLARLVDEFTSGHAALHARVTSAIGMLRCSVRIVM